MCIPKEQRGGNRTPGSAVRCEWGWNGENTTLGGLGVLAVFTSTMVPVAEVGTRAVSLGTAGCPPAPRCWPRSGQGTMVEWDLWCESSAQRSIQFLR